MNVSCHIPIIMTGAASNYLEWYLFTFWVAYNSFLAEEADLEATLDADEADLEATLEADEADFPPTDEADDSEAEAWPETLDAAGIIWLKTHWTPFWIWAKMVPDGVDDPCWK